MCVNAFLLFGIIIMLPNKPRILKLPFFAILFLTLSMPISVIAHLDLERAEPEDGDVLDTLPDKVQLWFGSELDTFESSVSVFDAKGHQVNLEDSQVSLEDRTLLQVSLPDDLPPGTYTSRWTAVDDEDAHPLDGELTFTIAGTPETADISPAAIGIAAVAGVGVLSAAWFWQKRRKTR